MEKKIKMRVSQQHWQIIIEFAEVHPEIVTNRLPDHLQGKQNLKNLWEELANKLNSLGLGLRTTDEWKKTLADWKSKTKKKASENAKDLIKTGGGPSCNTPLTVLEEKLLAIMGTSAVYGDRSASEIGIKRKRENQETSKVASEPVAEAAAEVVCDGVFDFEAVELEFQDHNYCPSIETPVNPRANVTNEPTTTTTNPTGIHNKTQKKDLIEMHGEVLKVLLQIGEHLECIKISVKSVASSLEIIASNSKK